MLINFNIEKLDKLLQDFYNLTGLTISVWDANFQQLSFQPKEMCNFCRIIKNSPSGKQRCYLSDKTLCMECSKTGKPATHKCHAGLIDTAIPISFKDSVMGYMMFGQVSESFDKDIHENIKKLASEIKVNANDLLEAYAELDTYDQTKTVSAANILKMATRYLWLSEYIEIGYNTIASQIDDYIKANIKQDISVQLLCDTFGISKNRLYEVSHDFFHKTIGNHIVSLRIGEAKRLLNSTNLPIHEIGELVGIKDYNYFTKFFKLHVGITPSKYRKTFPFNIHHDNSLSIE